MAPNVIDVAGPPSGIYLPFGGGRLVSLAVRVRANPSALAVPLRRAIFDLDPGLSVQDIVPLHDVGEENRSAMLGISSALTGIALIALLVSLAGVYSIVSLSVSQRTREIGVRLALGAARQSILWSVVRRSGILVTGGAVVGGLVGWRISGSRGWFTSTLPEVGPLPFGAVVGLVVIAAALACSVPARRALSLEPLDALRHEP